MGQERKLLMHWFSSLFPMQEVTSAQSSMLSALPVNGFSGNALCICLCTVNKASTELHMPRVISHAVHVLCSKETHATSHASSKSSCSHAKSIQFIARFLCNASKCFTDEVYGNGLVQRALDQAFWQQGIIEDYNMNRHSDHTHITRMRKPCNSRNSLSWRWVLALKCHLLIHFGTARYPHWSQTS